MRGQLRQRRGLTLAGADENVLVRQMTGSFIASLAGRRPVMADTEPEPVDAEERPRVRAGHRRGSRARRIARPCAAAGWLPASFFFEIEIAIEIAIEIGIGARQGKTRTPRPFGTGSIWRPDPDFDLDRIAPSGAHFISQPTSR